MIMGGRNKGKFMENEISCECQITYTSGGFGFEKTSDICEYHLRKMATKASRVTKLIKLHNELLDRKALKRNIDIQGKILIERDNEITVLREIIETYKIGANRYPSSQITKEINRQVSVLENRLVK